LLDDDARGQRLVLPADYQDALEVAQVHYGEINPDSFEGKTNSYGQPSYTLNYDIAPRHILSSDELNSWANAECAKTGKAWWWFDLLWMCYRNTENKAIACAAEDPARAQEELAVKRRTAKVADPSPSLVQRLAAHGVQYSTKIYYADGSSTWYFAIKDPNSAREMQFFVPVGASEKAILNKAYSETVDTGSIWSGASFRQYLH
jgi:hypothetical protein